MHANLMCAARLETTLESGDNGWLRIGTDDSVVGPCVLAMGNHRHFERVVPIASERRVDDSVRSIRNAPDKRFVTTSAGVVSKLIDQVLSSVVGASDDQQPRASCIEAMHDAWSHRITNAFDIREAGQQPVGERPGQIASTWMHHKAGRLVDDNDMVVFVHNAELHGRIGPRQLDLRERRRIKRDDLTFRQSNFAGRCGATVDEDTTSRYRRGGVRPADVAHQGDNAIESLAVKRCRNLVSHHAGTHASHLLWPRQAFGG